MKKWLEKQKYILVAFLIVTTLLVIMVTLQLHFITQPHMIEDLSNYIETNELSSSLINYAILAIINLIILGVWGTLFVIIMLKVLFPTKKSAKEAFQIDSLQFLYDMPKELRKELKRNE
jgi:ABC-type sulfate transport system permease component